MHYKQKQKGSLYLTVVLLGIVLAIATGVIGIVVNGSNLTKGLGDSVRAFHIADSGIEQTLYTLRKEATPYDSNIDCTSDFTSYGTSECSVNIITEGDTVRIEATGAYNGSQRRIEAKY